MPPETSGTSPVADFNGKSSKKGVIIAVVVVLVLAAAAGIAAYFVLKWQKQQETPPADVVKEQMNKLDALRNQTNPQPLTAEDLKKQSQELSAVRKEYDGAKPKPLTQEQINQQLEDLNKLRSQ